ncbi:MAG: hypothetical protein CMM74_04900 [Rhodospirillaceae bacterium]|nr:hypothetical protein [Rhodospirillaceae bacterium]
MIASRKGSTTSDEKRFKQYIKNAFDWYREFNIRKILEIKRFIGGFATLQRYSFSIQLFYCKVYLF